MKLKLISFTLIIILFLAFFIGIKYYDSLIFKDYKKFNQSGINGKIYSIDIRRRGVLLKIKNDSSTFVFYPYTNQELNGSHIFNYFAKSGDRVVKASFSDTLYLYKEDKIYRYTFRKFEK